MDDDRIEVVESDEESSGDEDERDARHQMAFINFLRLMGGPAPGEWGQARLRAYNNQPPRKLGFSAIGNLVVLMCSCATSGPYQTNEELVKGLVRRGQLKR